MWRPSSVASEARRNLGPAHVVLGLLLGLIVAGVLGYTILAAQQALGQEAQRRSAGSLVWTATAADQTLPLDGAACTRLGGWDGVAAAGGVAAQSPGPVYAFVPSETQVPVTGLTPGALAVFAPQVSPAVTTLGADLEALGGVGLQQWLVDAAGARTIQPTVRIEDAPVGSLTSTVTTPVPADTPILTCWLRMEPGAYASGEDLLRFAFPGNQAMIAPFLGEVEGVLTPAEQWRSAMALQPWLVGAAVLAIAVLLVGWTRRTEYAVYRTFGTTRGTATAMTAVELVIVAVPATAAAILAVAVAAAARWHGLPSSVLLVGLEQAAAAVLTGLALGIGLTPLLMRSELTQTLRDR